VDRKKLKKKCRQESVILASIYPSFALPFKKDAEKRAVPCFEFFVVKLTLSVQLHLTICLIIS